MFQVNDVVIYGQHGVCKIMNIGTLKMPMADKEKEYYTLKPIYRKDSAVYAPVEKRKVIMRPIITKEEAKQLIEHIQDIETVWIVNEKAREMQFKEALQTCDCVELVKIIKTLYVRKQQRLENGKKVTMVDEKYFHHAEEKLYEELAFALEIEKQEVEKYIFSSINNSEK